MDKIEVAIKIQNLINEGEALSRTGSDNADVTLWEGAVRRFLEKYFGEESREVRAVFGVVTRDARKTMSNRITELRNLKNAVNEGYYDSNPVEYERSQDTLQPLKVFLSHSGESHPFLRLEQFLRLGLGVETVVVEWLPFNGGTVPKNVREKLASCSCAVVFYEGTGKGQLIELGLLQDFFQNKIIYLTREGAAFGPMADAFARESFTDDNLEKVFRRTVTELRGWGFLSVVDKNPN